MQTMPKTLTLLSGKGGCGKTTLGLSMSSMLSDCKIKVLLVDCDLNTNGATYFYEEKLNDYGSELNSFYSLVFEPGKKYPEVIKINEYMDFLPSITKITKDNTVSYSYTDGDDKVFRERFLEICADRYDVVIFDCQAGYADIFRLVLPISDIKLFVMELDSINASSVRSLHLKIGNYLNEKVYQVFNKMSEEDYEIYSRIYAGTFFDNIQNIKFDWTIKKAFSLAQIPDMRNTSANFGLQVYEICDILFRTSALQSRLKPYKSMILDNVSCEEETKINEEIERIKMENMASNSRIKRLTGLMVIFIFLSAALVLYYLLYDKNILFGRIRDTLSVMITVLFVLVVAAFALFMFMDSTKEKREYDYNIAIRKKRLDKIYQERADRNMGQKQS